MHYTKVTINRDELTGLVIHVGAWELPILEAKHGEERMTVGELQEFKGRPWPKDARSEMQRLGQLYGRTGAGDNSPSFAEVVYGTGAAGIRALDAAIKAAIQASEGKQKKPRGRPAKGTEDLIGAAAG